MSKKRRKRRGHYCWCCGRHRANERFSGRGHQRHVCKDCMKLGKEELAYRQKVRDIDRLLNWDGSIRRKNRAVFERYLTHADERVRQYAIKVKEHDEQRRQELRQLYEAERIEEERWAQYWPGTGPEKEAHDQKGDSGDEEQEEIPF